MGDHNYSATSKLPLDYCKHVSLGVSIDRAGELIQEQ